MAANSYNSWGCRLIVYGLLLIAALVVVGSLARGSSSCEGSGFGIGSWRIGRSCSSAQCQPTSVLGVIWVPIAMFLGALFALSWVTFGLLIGLSIGLLIGILIGVLAGRHFVNALGNTAGKDDGVESDQPGAPATTTAASIISSMLPSYGPQ